MEPVAVYKCLCDVQRLRILNLLQDGPLCVCHLMSLLDETQVKISKQLLYMKRLGLLEVERQAQWRIYRIKEPRNPLLEQNLKCLQDLKTEDFPFTEDLKAKQKMFAGRERTPTAKICCLTKEPS